jgi:glycosyltransferase involved in cell wall biosynthesis
VDAPERVRLARQYEVYRSIETFLIMDADMIWAISEEEKKVMAGWGKPEAQIEVIPILMETDPTPAGRGQRRDLLFIGSPVHSPNLDAVRYYQREIVPEIRDRGLDLKLLLVGTGWENIADLDSQYTQVVGFVQDLKSVFGHCLAAFFPLISGAGMKGKVATAMGMGVPVITTPLGAEGYVHGDGVMLIGSTPAELADHIARLVRQDDLWCDLREAGLRYVSEHLSPPAIQAVVEQSIAKLIDSHQPFFLRSFTV